MTFSQALDLLALLWVAALWLACAGMVRRAILRRCLPGGWRGAALIAAAPLTVGAGVALLIAAATADRIRAALHRQGGDR